MLRSIVQIVSWADKMNPERTGFPYQYLRDMSPDLILVRASASPVAAANYCLPSGLSTILRALLEYTTLKGVSLWHSLSFKIRKEEPKEALENREEHKGGW